LNGCLNSSELDWVCGLYQSFFQLLTSIEVDVLYQLEHVFG
jgi:hypothetical protein